MSSNENDMNWKLMALSWTLFFLLVHIIVCHRLWYYICMNVSGKSCCQKKKNHLQVITHVCHVFKVSRLWKLVHICLSLFKITLCVSLCCTAKLFLKWISREGCIFVLFFFILCNVVHFHMVSALNIGMQHCTMKVSFSCCCVCIQWVLPQWLMSSLVA